VPEDQGQSALRLDHSILHLGFTAREVIIQIEDTSELALFAVLAAKRTVSMQRKFLSGLIAIVTKPLVQADRYAVVENGRDMIPDARP
jgi:hypothetical protein